jgi:hypothetical protein
MFGGSTSSSTVIGLETSQTISHLLPRHHHFPLIVELSARLILLDREAQGADWEDPQLSGCAVQPIEPVIAVIGDLSRGYHRPLTFAIAQAAYRQRFKGDLVGVTMLLPT